jgi:hypothetical protein
MTESSQLIEKVSRSLGLSPYELVERSLREYLKAKLRTARAEIHEVEGRYGVKKPEELEQRIREGTVEEHPTWEELIEYENLLDRVKSIQGACYLLRPTISG